MSEEKGFKIQKQEFLHTLEAVQPGLSNRDIIEQTSCFIFMKGKVFTFNEEVSCRAPTGLPVEFNKAVKAAPLISILRKLNEEELSVEVGEKQIDLIGKSKRVSMAIEDIAAPINTVLRKIEMADSWEMLPKKFIDAVSIVHQCASDNHEGNYKWTCVHVHPKYLEASDNSHTIRYKLKTPISDPVLIRKVAIKNVCLQNFTKFSLTDKWLHFKTKKGLILSCQRYDDSFWNIASLMDLRGDAIALPKVLKGAIERAEVFSSENSDQNMLKITIDKGKITLKGEGASGWYRESRKIKYKGQEIKFRITPKLFADLISQYSDCEIHNGSKNRMFRVDGTNFAYFCSLEDEVEK